MAKNKLYEVGSRDNEYAGLSDSAISKRPRTLYYLRGPGSPGPHGILMSPELYFDTFEEAQRAIPMLDLAYRAGRTDKRKEIMEQLNND